MTCKIGSFAPLRTLPPLREVWHAVQFASPEAGHAGRNVVPVSQCRRKSSASTRHAHVNHLQIGRSTSLQETCTLPDQVNLKVEFEIEDDGTELEIELTW